MFFGAQQDSFLWWLKMVNFECPECGEEITHERETMLVGKAQRHAENQHNMALEKDSIREGIEG